MYSKLAVSLLFGVSITMSDINSNDADTRYMISQFNVDEFPVAIDTCNPLDITGSNGYHKATCNDAESLTWTVYGDKECAVETGVVYELNSTWQTGLGTFWDFNCEGSVDAYAEIQFAIATCDTTSFVNMHAAVGVCALTGPLDEDKGVSDWVSIAVYCEENWAELQYYDSSTTGYVATCTEDYIYQIANATEECGFMLKTGGTKVYGYITDCLETNVTDATTTSTPSTTNYDSASQLSMSGLLVVAVIAAFRL